MITTTTRTMTTRKMKKTEIWRRDDGWEVCDRIPSAAITTPRPIPLTYEYAVRALKANGYRLEETE